MVEVWCGNTAEPVASLWLPGLANDMRTVAFSILLAGKASRYADRPGSKTSSLRPSARILYGSSRSPALAGTLSALPSFKRSYFLTMI